MALASDIITRARRILTDEGADTWTDSELIDWLNDGIQYLIELRPAAALKETDIMLVAGARQVFPPGLIHFGQPLNTVVLDINDNVTTEGDAVTVVSMGLLDKELPNWRAASTSDLTIHMLIDEDNLEDFWVYPPADGTRSLRALLAVVPEPISVIGDTVPLRSSQFINPLVDYLVYRAMAKDADEPAELRRGQEALQQFLTAVVGAQQARRELRQVAEDTDR